MKTDQGNRMRLLCVDDEPHVLEGLTRILRRDFVVATATGGSEGIDLLRNDATKDDPFAVVVSDMRMPRIDGAAFLRVARQVAPDSVRVLLTGQADLNAAIAAVNEGSVFRFLTKPCPSEVLLSALHAAAEQHRLITSERVLLERTLLGCVKALGDVLAIANPAAFGRAMRLKKHATMFGIREAIENRWQLEVAAMLSQIGSITLPAEVLEKVYLGKWLSAEEEDLVARLPSVAKQILSEIPRLEPVVEILTYQSKCYNGNGPPPGPVRGQAIPLGARILKVLTDFDSLEARGFDPELVLNTMRQRVGWYDPEILEAFALIRGIGEADTEVQEIRLRDVRVGMVFAEDVVTRVGTILIARGHEVSESLVERIRNIADRVTVVEPIRVIVKDGSRTAWNRNRPTVHA